MRGGVLKRLSAERGGGYAFYSSQYSFWIRDYLYLIVSSNAKTTH